MHWKRFLGIHYEETQIMCEETAHWNLNINIQIALYRISHKVKTAQKDFLLCLSIYGLSLFVRYCLK